MKRYLIMAAIALLIIGLAFVPPPLDPRHRRRSLLLATETPPTALTTMEMPMVTPAQTETGPTETGPIETGPTETSLCSGSTFWIDGYGRWHCGEMPFPFPTIVPVHAYPPPISPPCNVIGHWQGREICSP